MDVRIEQTEVDIRLVGKGKTVKTNRAFKMIPPLWSKAKKEGFMQELIDLSWENPKCSLEGILGVCGNEAAIKDEEFSYFMGVRYDGETPEGMETFMIPPSTWVVFPNITEAWKRLYTEWLPTSGYELANNPCIECYYGPGHKPRHELWVPVKPK